MAKAKANDKVKVHYKGTLKSGEVFDSSEGKNPLEFTLGQGQVIPGFDQGIHGMEINEVKTIDIPAAEAYGEVKQELIQKVPKENVPAEIKPEVGMKLVSKTPNGHEIPIVLTEVAEDSITIDANHPLAGKDLVFEVTLVEIN